MRRTRSVWIALALLGVALLGAWWLGSPLFLDRTVSEPFPASAPTAMGAEEAMGEAGMAADEEMKMATEEAMAAEEEMKMASEVTPASEMMADEEMKAATEEASAAAMAAEQEMKAATEAAMVTPTPSAPVALLAGAFRDVDSVHRGRGSATIYTLPDGSRTLRFEAFEVTNGPDLYVLLVPRRDPSADLRGAIELAALKGNVGDQNYALPPDLELTGEWSVLIWCKAFNVNFSIAALDPAP